MSNNKITQQISKVLPQETDRAIKLIAALTGEEAAKIAAMTPEEIFQYLAFLLKCEKKKVEELLREHNQSEELDPVSIARLWKLDAKHIVKGKKSKFGSMVEPFLQKLLFLMGQKTDRLRFMAENAMTNAASSEMITSLKPQISVSNDSRIATRLDFNKMMEKAANSNSLGSGFR